MGRPSDIPADKHETVGVYGIGMKRAIFKMGKSAKIISKTIRGEFSVTISPQWMTDDNLWDLPITTPTPTKSPYGTTIFVNNLREEISALFKDPSFHDKLINKIALNYACIIQKGFKVKINNTVVTPQIINFSITKNSPQRGIAPYIFKAKKDDIDIFIAIGYLQNSTGIVGGMETGITVICNDRVLLYNDRTDLVGWGDANVPQYHSQFNGIGGIVQFKGKPNKLPTTTTKHTIEAGAPLYAYAKQRMRIGLKTFTDFTNKWKNREAEMKKILQETAPISVLDLQQSKTKVSYHKIPGAGNASQSMPDLPTPVKQQNEKRISYFAKTRDIQILSDYFFEDEDVEPSKVGEKAFIETLKRVRGS